MLGAGALELLAAEAGRPRLRLLYMMKRSYVAIRGELEGAAQAQGLTLSDFVLLSFLKGMEPCSSADLARAERVTPQAAAQQVAQLKAKKMISTVEKAGNRRIALITMTPLGRDALAAISAEARALEDRLFDGMDAGQPEMVLAFLARTMAILEKKDESDDG